MGKLDLAFPFPFLRCVSSGLQCQDRIHSRLKLLRGYLVDVSLVASVRNGRIDGQPAQQGDPMLGRDIRHVAFPEYVQLPAAIRAFPITARAAAAAGIRR